jgi:hypothetical protein
MGQAGDFTTEVRVTSEMIDAGVSQLCDFEEGAGERPSEAVARIFRAMFAVLPPENLREDRQG